MAVRTFGYCACDENWKVKLDLKVKLTYLLSKLREEATELNGNKETAKIV